MNGLNGIQPESRALSIKFTGSGSEYFKIWIVNLILTILTLGIYSAWAKVRSSRYFYGNTRLDNSGFEYHATPMSILKGRLIAVTFLLIYVVISKVSPVASLLLSALLFLAFPWIIWRSIRFNAQMTSYRNVHFSFNGKLKEVYHYLLLLPLLPAIATAAFGGIVWWVFGPMGMGMISTLIMVAFLGTYALIPFIQRAITAYIINNYRYGQGKFSAELSLSRYYKTYLLVIAWSIGIFMIIGVLIGLIVSGVGIGIETIAGMQTGEMPQSSLGMMVATVSLAYLLMIMVGLWFKAYVKAKLRNYVFSKIKLDTILQLQSEMSVGRLFGLYAEMVLAMIFTLGLAYPWVVVSLSRYTANSTQIYANGEINEYVTQQNVKQSAIGEELGEAFGAETALEISF
jgi:uncharacterized membrane protein YjgN (DUF898 family)